MEPRSSKLEPRKRLTDTALKALVGRPITHRRTVVDGTVPGLGLRVGPGGAATWTLNLRVTGEGGVTVTGRKLRGVKHRINLGSYPGMGLQTARTQAQALIDQARNGINPKDAIASKATVGNITVEDMGKKFLKDYVQSKELDSAQKYELAFSTHIFPKIGQKDAEALTREEVRQVMEAARVRRQRDPGKRGGVIGGVEAARTTVNVLKQAFTWAQDEKVIRRADNPATKMDKNLPRKKEGEIVLTLDEARIVWQALKDCGYPFGTHGQCQLLSACRLDEWASAQEPWVDLREALIVIPADSYKSDHVHVMPLAPQAVEVLKGIPPRTSGLHLFSSSGGDIPIQGIAKFYKTRLADQILANTGAKFPKRLTTQTLRRTVATQVAEELGDQGDKLVKRILGHSDGTVTAIYNRYGYVREMRRVLEKWANALTATDQNLTAAKPVQLYATLPHMA